MHKGVKHALCSGCHFDRSDPKRVRMCENATGRTVQQNGKTITWCSHLTDKQPLAEDTAATDRDIAATA